MSTTTYSKEIHPGVTLFSRERGFRVFYDVCAAFLIRRASKNGSEGLEEMLLERVVNESAIDSWDT